MHARIFQRQYCTHHTNHVYTLVRKASTIVVHRLLRTYEWLVMYTHIRTCGSQDLREEAALSSHEVVHLRSQIKRN